MNDTYLAYYKYVDYTECPLRFKWRYVDRRPATDQDKPLNKLLGIVWNDVLEKFYRDKKYVLGAGCSAWMAEATTEAFHSRARELNVSWERGSQQDEYLKDALDALPKILETIRTERLLGEDMSVEQTLYADLPSGNRIGGRLDLRIAHQSVAKVLDFKGTKHKDGKYLSDRQLLWYGLLFQGTYHKFPDALGFWLLRFGEIKWVEATKQKVDDFIASIEAVFKGVQARLFEATPRPKACKFCQYRSGCDSWRKYQSEHRRPSNISEESDDLSEVIYV